MKMNAALFRKFHCGEVYATENLCIILKCNSCDEEFGIYTKFLDHIFGMHFEDWMASKKHRNTSAESSNAQKFNCGEIYATENLCMILKCNSCVEEFGIYAKFLNHIFGKHFDDWTATEKNKNTTGETSNAKECDEFATANEQNLEIDATINGCSNANHLMTDLLQPIEEEAVSHVDDIIEEKLQAQSEIAPEVSYKNVRPVRVFKKLADNDRERKYKCKICGFACKNVFNLRTHELRHSSIKPYACLKCDKAFYTSTELKHHTRRHTGEKPYVCTYCGMSFIATSILKTHERRHTGNRAYKCEHCDKSFYSGTQLRDHQVVHTKERNFTCEVCQAKFTRKTAMQNHKKLHENALRYECIMCHMRFNQKPGLLWHIKSKHNVLSHDSDSNSLTNSDPVADDCDT